MEYRVKKFHLRIAAIVLFSSFAATSGSFASTHDAQGVSPVAHEQNTMPLDLPEQAFEAFESAEMCLDENAQGVGDPFESPNMMPLASYQDCANTCKAGIVAIEAMCRFIPDPRAKAACFLARFTVPACIGFCGWYFGK